MIHFMMILVNFGVFALMLTDIRTEPRTDGPTDGQTNGRTDIPSYRDARTHLKIINNGTMSDDEEVASDVPLRYLFLQISDH